MPISIRIVTDEVTPMLEMMQEKLNDMSELALLIGQLWSDQMAFNFATANWPPLAAATVAEKEKLGFPMAPLFRTMEMYNAATSGAWQASGGVAVLEGPEYAGYHIEGTLFMPVRDFSFLDSSFDSQIGEAAMSYFTDDVSLI